MINLLDLVAGGLILFYLLRKAGGVLKTAVNLLMICIALIIFGIFSELIMVSPFANPIRGTLRSSYFVRLSHVMIRWVYPAVEKSAPGVDNFIKLKILSSPTPEAVIPPIVLPEKMLPKITLPDLPH